MRDLGLGGLCDIDVEQNEVGYKGRINRYLVHSNNMDYTSQESESDR